jgi:Tol biopolymer transport system component
LRPRELGPPLHDLWIAEADGSNPQQLTRGPGEDQGSPSWSPDGRRIVFDSRREDFRIHLWMIDVDGGAPRRLTAEAGYQVAPTWSHDGRWIYYSRWRADTRDIWRVPADGGGTQSADSPLMTMALPSGQARQLIACVKNSAFGVGLEACTTSPAIRAPTHRCIFSIRGPVGMRASAHWTDYGRAPGPQCVVRRQYNRVPQAGALTC